MAGKVMKTMKQTPRKATEINYFLSRNKRFKMLMFLIDVKKHVKKIYKAIIALSQAAITATFMIKLLLTTEKQEAARMNAL